MPTFLGSQPFCSACADVGSTVAEPLCLALSPSLLLCSGASAQVPAEPESVQSLSHSPPREPAPLSPAEAWGSRRRKGGGGGGLGKMAALKYLTPLSMLRKYFASSSENIPVPPPVCWCFYFIYFVKNYEEGHGRGRTADGWKPESKALLRVTARQECLCVRRRKCGSTRTEFQPLKPTNSLEEQKTHFQTTQSLV